MNVAITNLLPRAAAVLSIVSCTLFSAGASAAEGGAGHYVPGSMATMIDLVPTEPGWILTPLYLKYRADTPRLKALSVAGIETLGLEVDMDVAVVAGYYTFEQEVFGARYSVGVNLPYVWMTAEGEIETVIGDRRVRDSVSGLGDVTFLPAMLAWKNGPWQYDLALALYAPTGAYEVGRLANPGLNYWSINPFGGFAYSNPETGVNAALHGGLMFTTENPDTDYKTGTQVHLEGSLQQLLPAGKGFLSLGVQGFWVEQLSADSGQRSIAGDFKGRTAGIGPVLGYVLPMGEQTLLAEVRWLPELETKNRLKGDYFWLKVAYQF